VFSPDLGLPGDNHILGHYVMTICTRSPAANRHGSDIGKKTLRRFIPLGGERRNWSRLRARKAVRETSRRFRAASRLFDRDFGLQLEWRGGRGACQVRRRSTAGVPGGSQGCGVDRVTGVGSPVPHRAKIEAGRPCCFQKSTWPHRDTQTEQRSSRCVWGIVFPPG
jgi:hypothetical protein